MALWIIISYLILSFFCIYSINKLSGKDKKGYSKIALTSYISYSVIYFSLWIFKIYVPSYILLLTMITVLFDCYVGNYMGFYLKTKTFDRYLHAFGSFSFSLLEFFTLCKFVNTDSSKLFRAIFIFTLGTTLGLLYELMEARHDAKSNVKSQRGLRDTNMDMLSDVIGSALAGIFALLWIL